MGEQIERLAQFVTETQWNEIPEAVQQHARLVLLDTLGVILAGAEQPEVQRYGVGAWLAHQRSPHGCPPQRHCWSLD
jgi:2-methylcitrate dehydratase PrpD